MSNYEQFSEMVETFQNLLISYATGGQVTDSDFKSLRNKLLNESDLKDKLPRFVRTCSDLKQFWAFIKQQSSNYQGRREFLWNEFKPILQSLEFKTESPSDIRISETIRILNSDSVHEAWRDSLQRRIDDPDGAITSARTLLESVCKHILEHLDVDYDDKMDLPKLYKLTAEQLNLAPSQQTEAILRQVTGGCTTVIEGIGAMRNALGDAHGKGQSSAKPEIRHAELAVNLAGSLALFLIETLEAKKSKEI